MLLTEISEKEFNKLAQYVKDNFGINLTSKKKTLVIGRLQNVVSQSDFKSFSEYLDYVTSDKTGDAIITLLNKLTTNHTFFMREPEHFNYFKNTVLPYLESVQKHKKDIGIWSAGCSSGEEAYTLAMITSEYFGKDKYLWDCKILATDISQRVIQKATAGIYSSEQVSVLPEAWIKKHLRKIDNENYVISEIIKNEVIFRLFNLMNPVFPFKRKFHVIFCRNVMIYFDQKTKDELVRKFYEFIEPGGYLFIGHSESLTRDETQFKYIMPAVYRKE